MILFLPLRNSEFSVVQEVLTKKFKNGDYRKPMRTPGNRRFNITEKTLFHDGKAKSSRCKACESLGMRRTDEYAAVSKLERNEADGLLAKPSLLLGQGLYPSL
jgi:hypothetical protein